eukprot:TRINITY_DN22688_c0_g1_i1.p3 TRINITY_DN22688_c0_g1~~TRINITY_DN22688_c0_g1_i1.p3  ORF type:complete len:241 (-),score=47.93 TRINITY_DN22688_c0_g1_i1:364-1044(-)
MMDVLLCCAAALPTAMRSWQLGLAAASASPSCLLWTDWWACVFAISTNYLMHGFIWYRPAAFAAAAKRSPLRALGAHPVDVFAGLEVVAKLVQAVALAFYLGSAGCLAALTAARSAPMWVWAALGICIACGQGLNFATYRAIGNAGVYYGFKLGKTVPWCHGFPFNTGLRHPQYVGVVLTLGGALAVFLCEELAARGLPQLVVAWAAMYVAMCAVEQSGDNDAKAD